MRLDFELVSRGIARSRERAKEMVKSGAVTVNGKVIKKPSEEVGTDDDIVSSQPELYVGRGALKLEKAVQEFDIDFVGKTCIDIGASTGGFTEYMLNHGALRVYAVDVGHGQLAESLRNDSRVINMENTDIRTVSIEDINGKADFICTDVSFISLKKILPEIKRLLKDNAYSVILIKPQFEAGKKDIGKKGVVKDGKVHERVLSEINETSTAIGLIPENYTFSPIKGGSGNIEYLALLHNSDSLPPEHNFKNLVESAFKNVKESFL